VGIEHADDLVADLTVGLNAAASVATSYHEAESREVAATI
jgi:hypothetical protein